MKKLIFIIIIELIQINCFSQNSYKTTKISNDIELVKISDNAYIHISYLELEKYGRIGANGLIFINENKAFLFDSPWNDLQTEELVSWLSDSMKIQIIGFIPNHWHDDCMGGIGYLHKQNIESYANQMTIDIAKTKGLVTPKHGFKDSLQLQLGEKNIYCYYFGAAHSIDNIVVWIPSEQILFAGCMIKSLNSKDLGNIVDGDLIAYPKTLDSLMFKFPNAKIVIPGHGQIGGLDLIKHTKDLFNN